MERKFMKGNEAIAEAAVRAGCRFYAGYPITPQSEVPAYLSRALPKAGGIFVQGESEVASINMVYGAAAGGTLAMTSTSGPGISLMAEGISSLAAARVPSVIVDIMRAGPGTGVMKPAQSDYFQINRASGHGGYQTINYAPATIQEAVDLVTKAFDVTQKYRMPVFVFADSLVGGLMEAVTLPEAKEPPRTPEWAVVGKGYHGGRPNIVLNASFVEEQQMKKALEWAEIYEGWKKDEVMVEEYMTEDAEFILTAYGSCGRICHTCVDELREAGYRAGLIRPITTNPFPSDAYRKIADKARFILDVEMAIPALMAQDVELAVGGRLPVYTCLTTGGVIVDADDVAERAIRLVKGE